MITGIDIRADKVIAFERGSRFLKLRHKRSGKRPDEPVVLSREPDAKQIESELIELYEINSNDLRAAVKFAHAVHKMVANCGEAARDILLECSFDPKIIESVARTAPTRQRYELEQIAAGKRPLQKRKSGVPVLDTERFSEVANRLARARGLVQLSLTRVQLLDRGVQVSSSECERYINQLDDINKESTTLSSLVDEYGVVPRKVDKKATPQESPARPATVREACRGNAGALGLIAKNVRDIPRLPKNVKPTPEDVCNINRELKAIVKAAREERKLLKAIARDIPMKTIDTHKRPDLEQVVLVDGESQSGTYVLRIRVRKKLCIAFGRFKKGKKITVLPGEYSYVGSALGEKGAPSLAWRLVRHATRTGRKRCQPIRKVMLEQFGRIGLGHGDLVQKDGKTLKWNVDHLLDRKEASLVGVIAIRSPIRVEADLGRLLQNDPATTVFEPRLGANDLPGNTHLLRVDADECWWRSISVKMQVLVDDCAG